MTAAEEILSRLEHFGVRLGLERMRALLAAMNEPHLATPSVVVAGTNGKGSVSALIASILRSAGYRTGLFNSPHLEEIYERIRLDGEAIDDQRLAKELGEILRITEAHGCEPPTYFESFTLSAMRYFLSEEADIAVWEVGLGGRLDATNVNEPEVSVISSIGFDHMKQLGNSLGAIAGEKAGIFRSGKPAIAWADDPEVQAVLRAKADECSSLLSLAHEEVQLEAGGLSPQKVSLTTREGTHTLCLHLAGEHQLRNLAVAVLATESLRRAGWTRLTPRAIAAGVEACRWPGRLEWVDIPNGKRILLDAAHNPQGIAALGAYLNRLDEPLDLLFGVLEKKRVEEMLPPLAERMSRITLTRPSGSRGSDPSGLLDLLGSNKATVIDNPGEALDQALAKADGSLVVSGSLHLIGEIRSLVRQRFGVPPRTI